MATDSGIKKFAEQAMRVDRVLLKEGVSGNAGKVVYMLAAANKRHGVSQQEIVVDGSMSKDVVSKVAGSLVAADLLVQERGGSNQRTKTLITTKLGQDLLSSVAEALQPNRSAQETPKKGARLFDEKDYPIRLAPE